jgi:N-acetylmuramoyl-L-alanine amidase
MPSRKAKAAEAAERSRRAFLIGVAGLGAAGAGAIGLANWLFQREPRLPAVAIVTREAWGALPADPAGSIEGLYDSAANPEGYLIYDRPLTVALKDLIVHHTATGFDATPADIQRLHMRDRGYADVGYHYLIGADGMVYEGRALGARGAHTGGRNTGAIGVSLFGNFELTEPTVAQLDSLWRLSTALCHDYWIARLGGHRDYQPGATVCPGAMLWPRLPDLAGACKVSLVRADF